MIRYRIDAAKAEAQRFIDAIDAMNERAEKDDRFRRMIGCGVGFRETAAVRRASLDLSRSLSAMRKPYED
jgi:hypothetical protein